MSRDPSPTSVRNRTVSGHGSNPAPVQSPVRHQEQLVDPNVQELANILKTMQGSNPKVGAKLVQANDSFAKTWQDFAAPQAPKISQVPIISHPPVAREAPVLTRVPMINQALVASQAPMAHQTLVVSQVFARGGASGAPPAPMPLQPTPSGTHRRLVDVESPAPSAYVRKLCPLFFAGHCTPGQSCSDLHPNYDSQSGTFVDKRFITPEVFHKEAMTRAEKEKERDEALEALIKESREEADRKCHDSGSAARMKPRNIRVAAGITVAKNAKGEMDWIISNPSPPPPKPTRGPDRPSEGSGTTRSKKHHR